PLDLNGDPLPPGAVARLGSAHWRHPGGLDTACYSPDGSMLATDVTDGKVRLWQTATGKLLHLFPAWVTSQRELVFSPDNRILVAPGRGKEARVAQLWDVRTGKPVLSLGAKNGLLVQPLYNPTGKSLFVYDSEKHLFQYDALTGKEQRNFATEELPGFEEL